MTIGLGMSMPFQIALEKKSRFSAVYVTWVQERIMDRNWKWLVLIIQGVLQERDRELSL